MVTFANVNLLLHSYTSDEGIIFENKKSYKEISFDETNFIIQKIEMILKNPHLLFKYLLILIILKDTFVLIKNFKMFLQR